MQKRHFLATALAVFAATATPAALAQAKFPSQPIRLIVPYPAGGGTDFFARSIAPGMGEALGQQVIVENRPGASGMIGAQFVAKQAPADGHIILLGDMTTYAVKATMFEKQQQYDIQKYLAPVTPHLESGKLKPIAAAGATRIALYPNVPIVAESGIKGFDVEGWQGLTVRAGTPEPVIKAIAAAYAKAVAELKKKLSDAGIDTITSTPEQFAAHIQAETVRWRNVIRDRGIKAE